jgi:pimeloyl-ACP methyl ester carboxylesterase
MGDNMKRVVFKNSRKLSLVGNLYSAGTESIIIMCHGFASDQNSQGRFKTMANSLMKYNFSSLSFDFSGCGESDDERITLDKLIDDLNSAIAYVKTLGFKKIALFSHSLGGFISLKCFSSEITTMVLLGPQTGPRDFRGENYNTPEQLQELKEKGYFTFIKKNRIREKIIVDEQLHVDLSHINQYEVLKKVTCPILIIHGNNGENELEGYKNSETGIDFLSKESKLEVIDGANHSFVEHYDTVIKLTTDWFLNYLQTART